MAAPPSSPGLKTQKVTGFADCGDRLYASINTNLFRRNDGTWNLLEQTLGRGQTLSWSRLRVVGLAHAETRRVSGATQSCS